MFTPEHFAAFDEFVQKFGGSMLFLAGPRANPGAYRGTALEKILPVEIDTAPPQAAQSITVELTPQGRTHPMFKLAATDDESAAVWKKMRKDLPALVTVRVLMRTGM